MNTTIRANGDIKEQIEWIVAHGGDLLGYRAEYGADYADPTQADKIYAADVEYLRRLQGFLDEDMEYEAQLAHINAIDVLGEGYFD